MALIFFIMLFFLFSWLWSVYRGLQVSVLCAVLSFLFPPVAQIVFAIYEQKMRAPAVMVLVAFGLIYLFTGDTSMKDAVVVEGETPVG